MMGGMSIIRLGFLGVAGLVLLLLSFAISASSLQVWPTRVFIAAERGADGLRLHNSGGRSLHAQVRVFYWSQINGEDVLEPARELAVSPPMLELEPGAEQLVRVVRLGPPPANREVSYRLVVDELPLDEEGSAPQSGLKYVLRYSIPVFLSPLEAKASPVLHTRLTRDGKVRFLEIDNVGTGHAQIAELAFVHGEQRVVIAPGLSGYVLPGQSRRWILPDALKLTGDGAFKARINGEVAERTLAPATAIR